MHSDVQRAVRRTGIKIDPATINGPFADSMEKSVYNGTAKALFEYYMYSSLDAKSVAASMSMGVSPAALRQGMLTGQAPQNVLAQLTSAADAAQTPNAAGGMVTGLMGKMAKVASFPPAPPGEGWASVAPGERIMPGGRGGGKEPVKVELIMKQDMRRFIEARVVDGAAQFERNKRLR
jgi:hypothetical protein